MQAYRRDDSDGRDVPDRRVFLISVSPAALSEIPDDAESLDFRLFIPLLLWFVVAVFVVGYELHQIIINSTVRKML